MEKNRYWKKIYIQEKTYRQWNKIEWGKKRHLKKNRYSGKENRDGEKSGKIQILKKKIEIVKNIQRDSAKNIYSEKT